MCKRNILTILVSSVFIFIFGNTLTVYWPSIDQYSFSIVCLTKLYIMISIVSVYLSLCPCLWCNLLCPCILFAKTRRRRKKTKNLTSKANNNFIVPYTVVAIKIGNFGPWFEIVPITVCSNNTCIVVLRCYFLMVLDSWINVSSIAVALYKKNKIDPDTKSK